MIPVLAPLPQEVAVVLELFQSFLALHANPDSGPLLHDLYADEAPIALDGRLLRKGETDVEAFSQAHRRACMEGIGTLPVFDQVDLLAENVEEDGRAVVGWFRTMELGDGQSAIVGLGIRRDGGQWRVGWCTVASSVQNWSYSQGLVQTLAVYPWMLSDQPVRPRSSLDASYCRLFRQSDVHLRFLPESRFSCHMSGGCCKFDYHIALPPAAQVLIDAIPWEDIKPALKGTTLEARADGQLQLKDNHETCRFMDEQRQCLIHETLGHQPFGPCGVFPFAFAETPEGVSVSTSLVCGSVRNRLGPLLAERQFDVRERLFLAPVRKPNGFRLAPGLEIPWESFRQIETVLLDLLDKPQVPLRQRLYAGNRLLHALRVNEPIDVGAWLEEPPGQLPDAYRETLRTYLARIFSWDRQGFTRLPKGMSLDLRPDRVRDELVVVDLLRNLQFSKAYSYPYDLTTAHNLSILLYVLTGIMQSSLDGPLPDELWRELAALGGHGLLASLLPESAPQELKEFLGSSEFGQWALWY